VYSGDIYQIQVYALSDAGRGASWNRFLLETTPPYKFLSPFALRDQPLFKGRDAEIQHVLFQIGQLGMVIIDGQAGSGKTSLLAAGVVPALAQAGALVVHLHDYHQPIESIRQALAANAKQIPISFPDPLTLPSLARAVFEDTRGTLVLILDQFERLFEQPAEAVHRAALLEGLVQAMHEVNPAYVRPIIAVREDALPRLREALNRLGDIHTASFHLPLLNREQAQAAIEEPLRALKYPVSSVGDLVLGQVVPGLADTLDTVTDSRDAIYPPHLQIVCHRLYQAARARHPPHIDQELYFAESGGKGVPGILYRYMEEELRTQLADHSTLAWKVMQSMASPGLDGWIMPDTLKADGASPGQIGQVLARLEKMSLLISH